METKELVNNAGFFCICFYKRKNQYLYPWPFYILWEVGRRTIDLDTDFFSRNDMLRVIEPVQNSSTYIFDNAFELNGVALVTKIGLPGEIPEGK